jgi:hypothetical protein
MNRRITITFFCILAAATRLASGQNDPFETNVPSPEKRAGSAAAKGLARPLEVGEETDAAILSLRRSNPKTPEQLIEAVRVVFDLGRFDEASNYIDRLLELNLDDATLAALRSRPGSDFFLRIANQESLTAARREFGVRVLDASARVTRDADRLSALVPKLSDASLQVRAAAGSELILAGRSAIPPLVTVLADAARSNEHPAIRQLLVRLGKDAVEPLVGTLQSDDPQLKAQVIRVLGKLNATRCVSYFLAPAILPDANAELQSSARDALARTVRELPSRDDACRFLARRIQAHLGGESPVAVGSDGTGELWDWDATARRPVPWMLDARTGRPTAPAVGPGHAARGGTVNRRTRQSTIDGRSLRRPVRVPGGHGAVERRADRLPSEPAIRWSNGDHPSAGIDRRSVAVGDVRRTPRDADNLLAASRSTGSFRRGDGDPAHRSAVGIRRVQHADRLPVVFELHGRHAPRYRRASASQRCPIAGGDAESARV